MRSWQISRRHFLRGTGAAMGLPMLEAMDPGHGATRAASAGAPPKRIGFMYFPNGIIHDTWKPVSEGRDYALPYALEPLASVREDMLVLSGLSQIPYGQKKGVGHARPTAALLTGAVAEKDGVKAGRSIDQLIADKVGADTPYPSMQLSVHETVLNGRCDRRL